MLAGFRHIRFKKAEIDRILVVHFSTKLVEITAVGSNRDTIRSRRTPLNIHKLIIVCIYTVYKAVIS